MIYWFQDPLIKGLLPLATSTSMKGLTTYFNVPSLIIGANVFPEGIVIGPSIVDVFNDRLENKRIFFVTDEFCERFAQRITRVFEPHGYATEIWNKALPEAPLDNVKECAASMTSFEPDLIFAVGGGSVIDGAKAAWILYERPDITDLRNMVSPLGLLGLRKKAGFAAVPTTSGTGSECTPFAVLHDPETHCKVPIMNGDLYPDIAILDPEFTMSMPPNLTAWTGLDALAHAIDAVLTPAANELTDAMGLAAIKSIFRYLPRAYHNGKDREARYRMMIAASMAGISFGQNSAALTHGLGHPLGSFFELHHGLSVGVFIPYALQYYRSVTDKHLDICDALRIDGVDSEERFEGLVNRVKDLLVEMDVPLNLKGLDIPQASFNDNMEEMVAVACEDIDTYFSPRPVTTAQCEAILRYAYEGRDIDF